MELFPDILEIQSDTNELQKVEVFLRVFFQKHELPDHAFNKVFLCVSEAVINSIEHGNKNERNKRVCIEVSCHDNGLQIAVIDEGEGFNHQNVEDPTSQNNILNETGRGIFIMKSICNELIFSSKGNCVMLNIELI